MLKSAPLPKIRNWYHATDTHTAEQILSSGALQPQPHLGDRSLGVFFAQSQAMAGLWPVMRGHHRYAVFKIPRLRFTRSAMHPGGADRMPSSLGMICMRYLDTVPVSREDMTLIEDQRSFSVPGLRWHVQGTGKLSVEIEDRTAFDHYIAQQRAQHPEFDRMVQEREAAQ